MMRFAAGLTATGIIGFLLLEALKILMVPITAWVMGLLAMALKIFLITAGLYAGGILGYAWLIGGEERLRAEVHPPGVLTGQPVEAGTPGAGEG